MLFRSEMSEQTVSEALYTAGCPDPDLLIRCLLYTSGESFDLGSELLIDRVIEPETGDRVEHLMQVAGRVDDALPGKKYDFQVRHFFYLLCQLQAP